MKLRKREIKEKLIACEGGGAAVPAEEERQLTDQELLDYAKTSLKLWRADPSANSELPLLSLFMILNDGESDLMASWEELEVILNYVEPLKNENGEVTVNQHDRAKQAFDKHQTGGFLSFRQFQQFMKDLDLDVRAETIETFLYRYNYRTNCCTLFIGRCCARRFRAVRMKQVANRLKKMVEIEN